MEEIVIEQREETFEMEFMEEYEVEQGEEAFVMELMEESEVEEEEEEVLKKEQPKDEGQEEEVLEEIEVSPPGHWIFTEAEMQILASRQYGMSDSDEKANRRRAANFIRNLGEKLNVSTICILTAQVYMHRFFMYHPFQRFNYFEIGLTCMFCSSKSTEQIRRIDDVIKAARELFVLKESSNDGLREKIIDYENLLVLTLGFELIVDHPHTHIIQQCRKLGAPDHTVAKLSFLIACNSQIHTRMCIRFTPTVIACVCILAAAKLLRWDIPRQEDDRDWCSDVDPNVKLDKIIHLVDYFIESSKPPDMVFD